MSLHLKCSTCGMLVEAEDSWIGLDGDCPGCENKLIIKRRNAFSARDFSTKWHFQHPDYVARALKQAPIDAACEPFRTSSVLTDVNVPNLAENGCIKGWTYHNGRLHAVLGVEGLVTARAHHVLRKALRTKPANSLMKTEALLIRYYDEDFTDNAREELRQTTPSMLALLMLFFVADAFNDAQEHLSRLEKNASWISCAKVWKQLYGDPNEAMRCLEQAMRCAYGCNDWLEICECWLLIFQDEERALEAMRMAQGATLCALDWLACAQAWLELFNRISKARTCLDLAHERATFTTEWIYCAETGKRLNVEQDTIIEWFDIARSQAETAPDLEWCARAQKDLFNEPGEARTMLELSEQAAGNFEEWRECGQAWLDVFNEEGRALCALQTAQEKVEDAYDWVECARAWKEFFGDEDKMRLCLTRAKGRIESAQTGILYVDLLASATGESHEVLLQLEAAIKRSETCDEWAACTRATVVIVSFADQRDFCLREMVKQVRTSADALVCAELFTSLLGDLDKTSDYLEKAEDYVQNSLDLISAARAWKSLANYEDEARRCLWQATDTMHGDEEESECEMAWLEMFGEVLAAPAAK